MALTIAGHILADDEKVYTVMMTFRGPRGQAFGSPIPIKVMCASDESETNKELQQKEE